MKKALLIFWGLFIVMQFIRPTQENTITQENLEIQAKPEIKQMFKTSCYDCHSNSATWPWYSQIAPFSWIITSHVDNGRKALNFSTWNSYDEEKKQDKLRSIYKKVYAAMPLESYTAFHEDAKLSKEQRETIREWAQARP